MDDDETESLATTTVSTQNKRELQPSVVEALIALIYQEITDIRGPTTMFKFTNPTARS